MYSALKWWKKSLTLCFFVTNCCVCLFPLLFLKFIHWIVLICWANDDISCKYDNMVYIYIYIFIFICASKQTSSWPFPFILGIWKVLLLLTLRCASERLRGFLEDTKVTHPVALCCFGKGRESTLNPLSEKHMFRVVRACWRSFFSWLRLKFQKNCVGTTVSASSSRKYPCMPDYLFGCFH